MLEASRRDWVATAASLVTLLLLSVPALLQLPATSEGEASTSPRPRARYIPDTSSRAIYLLNNATFQRNLCRHKRL